MNRDIYTSFMTIILLLTISTTAHARMEDGVLWGAPADNGPVYAMMGGHGGMGGNGGGGMMGSGQGMSAIWDLFSGKRNDPNRDYEVRREREDLRREIREKRQELKYLLRSDTPDRDLIDQKIVELNRLEDELDSEMYRSNNSR